MCADGTNLRHLVPSQAASCKPWPEGINWKQHPLVGRCPVPDPAAGCCSRRVQKPWRRGTSSKRERYKVWDDAPPPGNRYCCCGLLDDCCCGRPSEHCSDCCSKSRRARRASRQVAPGMLTHTCRKSYLKKDGLPSKMGGDPRYRAEPAPLPLRRQDSAQCSF
jgi:hypothetical protein